MKIRFRGQARTSGSFTGSGKSIKHEIKKQKKDLRKDLRKDLKKERKKLEKELKQRLRKQRHRLEDSFESTIEDALRDELYSSNFANFLRSIMNTAEDNGFADVVRQYMGEDVELTTTAGTISGTVQEVGTDYVLLRESDSTILIVPFSNASAIRPL